MPMSFSTNPECQRRKGLPRTVISDCGLYLIGPPDPSAPGPSEWQVWHRESLSARWCGLGVSRIGLEDAAKLATRRASKETD